MSNLEFKLSIILRSMNIKYETQYKFEKKRKWKSDFYIPSAKLIIECEGGVFTRGRHNRPIGFIKDIEKYNKIIENGLVLLRYSIDDFKNQSRVDSVIKQIHSVILKRQEK